MLIIVVLSLIISLVAEISTHKLCSIQLLGWGYDDPNCPSQCGVHIKLNDHVVYESLRVKNEDYSGFHLGVVNVISCSLFNEPQVFETHNVVEDNIRMSDFVDAFPLAMEEVVMVVVSGNQEILGK